MGAVFLLYIVYCVVVMYIPQSRQFLIDGVMSFVHTSLLVLKIFAQPEFWKGAGVLVLIAAAIALVVFIFSQILENAPTRVESGGDILFILFLMAVLIAAIVVLFFVLIAMVGIGAVVMILFFIGPPIIGGIILVYLPAALLLLYKYIEYLTVPHEAELQFNKIKVAGQVRQKEIDAVRDAMLQSDTKGFSTDDGLVNVKNVLFGWIHSENRKEHLRRLREEMEEETESLNAFREYVRAKNRR